MAFACTCVQIILWIVRTCMHSTRMWLARNVKRANLLCTNIVWCFCRQTVIWMNEYMSLNMYTYSGHVTLDLGPVCVQVLSRLMLDILLNWCAIRVWTLNQPKYLCNAFYVRYRCTQTFSARIFFFFLCLLFKTCQHAVYGKFCLQWVCDKPKHKVCNQHIQYTVCVYTLYTKYIKSLKVIFFERNLRMNEVWVQADRPRLRYTWMSKPIHLCIERYDCKSWSC